MKYKYKQSPPWSRRQAAQNYRQIARDACLIALGPKRTEKHLAWVKAGGTAENHIPRHRPTGPTFCETCPKCGCALLV